MRDWILDLGFRPSLFVAASSSVFIGLGAPPGGWVPGEWIGFVPLILMVQRLSVTARQAFVLGWVGGLGIGLVGFPWLAEMMVRFAGLPWVLAMPALLVFSAWMAVPFGLFGLGVRLGPQHGVRAYLWPMVLFVALMFVWPNLFPYTPLLGFAEVPALMQSAEWIGVHGIEAIVVGWAVCVARAVTQPGARWRRLLFVVLLPPLMMGVGHWRMQAILDENEGAPMLTVGIVQPNVPPGGATAEERLERLWWASAELEKAGAEVVVWPEAGTYPYLLPRSFSNDQDLGSARILGEHGLPTLFGAGSKERGARFGFNSFYYMDAQGEVRGQYDKVNRVPFGEAIPVPNPEWVAEQIPYIRHLYAGAGPTRFVVETANESLSPSFGPLICYEDILPSFVLEVAAQPGGVDLFVNATIDAWYGYGAEPWEHLALAQFRSVEHRIPLVRSTSTGVSAVVDATGRLTAFLPVRPVEAETLAEYPPDFLLAEVYLARNTETAPTLYARVGWLLPYFCVLSSLWTILLKWRSTRRPHGPVDLGSG